MHSPSQFPRKLLDLRLHAVATGFPLEEEFAPSRLAADEGHTEEVEGLPRPRCLRLFAAWRPNSIRRVFFGCSDSENSCSRSRIASQKRRASVSCSKPTTISSAYRTMIMSPVASRRRQRSAQRSKL